MEPTRHLKNNLYTSNTHYASLSVIFVLQEKLTSSTPSPTMTVLSETMKYSMYDSLHDKIAYALN